MSRNKNNDSNNKDDNHHKRKHHKSSRSNNQKALEEACETLSNSIPLSKLISLQYLRETYGEDIAPDAAVDELVRQEVIGIARLHTTGQDFLFRVSPKGPKFFNYEMKLLTQIPRGYTWNVYDQMRNPPPPDHHQHQQQHRQEEEFFSEDDDYYYEKNEVEVNNRKHHHRQHQHQEDDDHEYRHRKHKHHKSERRQREEEDIEREKEKKQEEVKVTTTSSGDLKAAPKAYFENLKTLPNGLEKESLKLLMAHQNGWSDLNLQESFLLELASRGLIEFIQFANDPPVFKVVGRKGALQQQQQQPEQVSTQQTVCTTSTSSVTIAPMFENRGPLSFPPPMLIREGSVQHRDHPSLLVRAPPPFRVVVVEARS